MPTYTIQVSAPCTESWAAMTPTASGRHCAACQKTVVDFTQKTDAEILAYLAHATRSQTCGRFRGSQLARPLQPPATTSRWRAWLSALLALGSTSALLAPKATAQTILRGTAGPVPMATSVISPPSASSSANNITTDPASPDSTTSQPPTTALAPGLIEIRGIVLDAAQCDPLPGVMVLVKGTTVGTATDIRGEFKLTLPPTEQPVQLVLSFVGYSREERTVTAKTATSRIEVALEAAAMGMLVMPFHPPLPWHPRAFYHWGKYWLTRPFRR